MVVSRFELHELALVCLRVLAFVFFDLETERVFCGSSSTAVSIVAVVALSFIVVVCTNVEEQNRFARIGTSLKFGPATMSLSMYIIREDRGRCANHRFLLLLAVSLSTTARNAVWHTD